MTNTNIKFDKRKLESLKSSTTPTWYYAQNFEGIVFSSLIIRKIFIFSWAKQIP
jgi:hypothetical protein